MDPNSNLIDFNEAFVGEALEKGPFVVVDKNNKVVGEFDDPGSAQKHARDVPGGAKIYTKDDFMRKKFNKLLYDTKSFRGKWQKK